MIEKEDYRIESERREYTVLVRNKWSNEPVLKRKRNPVLFVHGATYGSTDTFDYEIDGYSWMDFLAQEGFDVWCIDLLGYGGSDRPLEMQEAPENNPPIIDTEYAISDIHRAVSFILDRQDCEKIDLIGYSWGTATCGTYAGRYQGNVGCLILSGALWLNESPAVIVTPSSELGAYRTVSIEAMMKRWVTGLTQSQSDAILSESDRRVWCEKTASCDPMFSETGLLRAPTGVIKDFSAFNQRDENWYDPSLIQCPVHIVVGELDQETTPEQAQEVFARLSSAETKQLTIVGNGTHSLLLENNRHQLHEVSRNFLMSSNSRDG